MSHRLVPGVRHWASIVIGVMLVMACSRNPATNKLEAFVPNDSEEVALGREADLQLRETVELYGDSETLLEIVRRVGARVAASTERPELPWQFAIVDDPEPNAFALPGGSVYVTRGLLAHLNTEAELAAVLAHECGHVTARHGVKRLQRLAREQHRDGRSSIEVHLPNIERIGMAGGSRFLARSRDEELLADDLGLRYLKQANYDPLALAGVLDTLATLHGGPGREQPHTHPTTVHRRARIHLATGRDPKPAYDAGYVETLDGLLFGPDPRDGYFKDDHFVHPQLGFALALPKNWTVEYREGRALAKNPESNTYLVVSESRSESVRGGMNEIFSGDVAKKEPWSGALGTGAAAMAEFSTIYDGRELHAFIGLVEFEGKIIQVVAFSPVAQWPAQETRGVFKSFSAATTAQRDVQPMKVELVELDTPMTLEHFYETHPSSVPLGVIARINRVKHPEATLPAGHRLKRVRGFNPDFASIQR